MRQLTKITFIVLFLLGAPASYAAAHIQAKSIDSSLKDEKLVLLDDQTELDMDVGRKGVSAPSAAVKDEDKDKKESSTLGSLASFGSAAVKEIGGVDGIKKFGTDYMTAAKAVEQIVTDEQNERIKNGQTANKATEVWSRLKQSPTMIKFVVTRAVIPFLKALFSFGG